MKRTLTVISVIIAIGIIGAAYYYDTHIEEKPLVVSKSPVVGTAGSEHTHMSMLVIVDGVVIDFSVSEYQLQSDIAHFEDENGTYIHKHATGVTLPYFFKTLKMELTKDCLTTRDQTMHCTDQTNKLSIFINRARAEEVIDTYELQRNDQILINYGPDDETELRLKLNAVLKVDAEL